MDNTNTTGVTASSTTNAALATTGLEMLIPYADLNLPATPELRAGRTVRVAVSILRTSGHFGNQWLPACPPATTDLGLAPDMNAIAGQQFLTLTLPTPAPDCGTADFNGDSDFGTDADIESFFACLAGACCPTCYPGGADFNADGDTGTDADIESFFRVLAGGAC